MKFAKKMLKGLLIDPEKQTITEVDVWRDEYGCCLESMYEHIDCSCVDVIRELLNWLPSECHDDIWVDDEGGWTNKKHMFLLPGFVPLVGRGLILGYRYDDKEETIVTESHSLTPADIELLNERIRWMERTSE